MMTSSRHQQNILRHSHSWSLEVTRGHSWSTRGLLVVTRGHSCVLLDTIVPLLSPHFHVKLIAMAFDFAVWLGRFKRILMIPCQRAWVCLLFCVFTSLVLRVYAWCNTMLTFCYFLGNLFVLVYKNMFLYRMSIECAHMAVVLLIG